MWPAEEGAASCRLGPKRSRAVIERSELIPLPGPPIRRHLIRLLLSSMLVLHLTDCIEADEGHEADSGGRRSNELVGRVELPVEHLLELLRNEEESQLQRSPRAIPSGVTRTRRAQNFSPSGFRSMLMNSNGNNNNDNDINNLASDTMTDFVARRKRRRKRRSPLLEQPPSELMFSNSTGAVVHCGVAFELALSVGEADKQQQRSSSSSPAAAIQIRWERANGLEVEPISYAGGQTNWPQQPQPQPPPQDQNYPALRHVRPSDGALVFEPFAAQNLRPDVHATSYRCVASLLDPATIGSKSELAAPVAELTAQSSQLSGWRHASAVSRDMRLRGVVSIGSGSSQQSTKITVQDELVSEGNSAHFKCQIPFAFSGQLQLAEWLEFSPTGASLAVHTAASDLSPRPARRHFVHPKTGELVVIQVDASLRGRGYKCRCRNKLTGELVTSSTEGKLYVSESGQATPPKVSSYQQQQQSHLHNLFADSFELGNQHTLQQQQQQMVVYEEGESGLLVCHLQANPRVQFNWFREEAQVAAGGNGPELIPLQALSLNLQEPLQLDREQQFSSVIGADSGNESVPSLLASNSKLDRDQSLPPVKYVQLANLLIINQMNRNDSGQYVCLGRNSLGETRLSQRLEVRSRLRVRLTASSNVLELGKSLVLECSIEGAPIHQVVFRHNQAIIKSISGADRFQLERRRRPKRVQKGDDARGGRGSGGSNYFVLENDDDEEDEGGDDEINDADDGDKNSGSSNDQTEASGRANKSRGSQAKKSPQGGKQTVSSGVELSHVMAIVLEPQHAGAYQCFAHNQFESSQATVYIRVLDEPPHFKETFKSELYQVGQDISLRCTARANPLPEITWTIDEQPIAMVEQQNSGGGSQRIRFGDYVSRDNLVISYVNISQVQVADGGLYKCTADTRLARISYQAQIKVAGEVQVKSMPNLTVLAGTTFRQRCLAVGWPLGEVQWHHAGHRLPVNHRQRVHENGTLEVEHVEKGAGDEGEYTCLVYGAPHTTNNNQQQQQLVNESAAGLNSNGLAPAASIGTAPSAQGSLFVSIRARPTIEPFQAGRQLREGQRASIMCTISSGDLPISISWFRNEQLLLPVAELVQAELEQQGGDWLRPSSTTSAPSATRSQPVALVPAATGPHPYHIEWQPQAQSAADHSDRNHNNNNNHSILAGVRISRVSDYSSTLLFESLLAHHTGNYTCLARNDVGQSSHRAPMIVQVAPKWSIEPADKNVVRGSGSSIDCMASGFPAPRVIWTKAIADTQPAGSSSQQQQFERRPPAATPTSSGSHHLGVWRSIVSSPHLQVFENGSLNILDAQDLDDGHYMCQASNGVGPGLSKVIKITINVAAQFQSRHSVQYVTRGEQTHLKCQAKGDWPLAIFWFKNRHKLEPINLRDSYQSPSKASAAAAAAAATATATTTTTSTNNSADKPEQQTPLLASTNANVLSVLATASNSGPDNQLNSNASLNQLASWSGVRQFELESSQNSNQNNAIGLVLERYTLQTADYLLTPQHSSAISLALNELKLDGGQALRNTLGQLATRPQQPVVVQTNSVLTIQRVQRQDTGTFKCLAANNFGRDERIIQLVVQEAPDKIEELSIMEVSSQSISLGWLAPFDGNAPILSYHIQYKALPKTSSPLDLSTPRLAHQHQGVQRAAAMDQLGSDETSTGWLNYSIVPASLVGPSHSADSMRLSSASAKAMALQQEHSSAGQQQQVNKMTLNSLRPVTRYWFRLEAENKLGRGPPSSIIETVTLEEAPGAAPGKVEGVAKSSSTIRVSWNKLNERDIFGSVQGYYVGYRPLLQAADQTNTQAAPEQQRHVAEPDKTKTSAGGSATTNIYKTIQHDDKLNRFEAVLTGLKKSTKYLISVQAFNERGTGPASEPIAIQTRDLDPPRQLKLFVRQATNCSIKLEWRPLSQAALTNNMAPADGIRTTQTGPMDQTQGDVVDFYSLFMAEQTQALEQQQHQQQQQQPQRWLETRLPANVWFHSVEKLKCGTRYQFQMSATNKIDTGDKSETLDTKTAGGLPIAPDRQSTFDVLNTTCYVVRLDHWQDNGCPIRSMNVRYRLEKSRDWTQLANFQFDSDSPGQREAMEATSSRRLFARSVFDENLPAGSTQEDPAHALTGDYQMGPVASDELEDDMSAANSFSGLDYSDLQAASLIAKDDSGENLYGLLRESELDGRELSPPHDSPVDSVVSDEPASSHRNSPRSNPSRQQQRAQEWQAFNFVLDKSGAQTTATPTPPTSAQLDDWRRGVHLCNLLENNFYVVQIRVENRVGETEAELRLLTSSEGLEYDQDIKRHVVGRLAGGLNEPNGDDSRKMTGGDSRLALIAFGQWPMLMPITLIMSMLTVLIIVIMLVKNASPNERCNGAGGGGTSPDSSTGSRTTSTSTASSRKGSNPMGQLNQNCHPAAVGRLDPLEDSPRVALSSSVSVGQPGGGGRATCGYHHATATMQRRYSPVAPTIADTTDGSELALGAAAVDNYATIVSGPVRHATSLFAGQQQRQAHNDCRRGDNYTKEHLAALLPTADEIHLAQNVYLQHQQHKTHYGPADHQTGRMQPVVLADDTTGSATVNFVADDQFGSLAAGSNQTTVPSQSLSPPTNVTSGISSCNSNISSANASAELHFRPHHTLPPHSSLQLTADRAAASMEQHNQRGLNVYLCAANRNQANRELQQTDATIFYGLAQPAPFDQDQLPSAVDCDKQQMQVRHFQMNNDNSNSVNFECQQEACRQQAAAAAALPNESLAAHLTLDCNYPAGYDPVYATIRRTFPQAFKYLTLQQNKSHTMSEPHRNGREIETHANTSEQLDLGAPDRIVS